VVAWVARRPDTQPPRVTAATLAGVAVAFDADPATLVQQQNRNVFSTRRSRLGEAMIWVFVVVIFSTAVMVRRHLRGGEADLHGARTLAMVVTLAGLLSIVLQAHHVSDPLQELLALISGTGWALLWAGFSWLAYLAFEPHVRRLWPRTLIAWTRVLSGRWRDPLVGSDLLLGILIGTGLAVTTLLIIMTNERGPSDASLAPALDSLRSSRVFVSRLLFLLLDSMQFALGGLFMLALLRLLVGRTWLVVIGLIMLNVPLSAWSWTPVAVLYAMATAVLFVVVVLRLGLLAAVAMLASERVLTSLPITLDFSAWYVATSGLTLALVLAIALWAFRLSLLRGGAAVAAT
jgi:serine/threonine-protein kinase